MAVIIGIAIVFTVLTIATGNPDAQAQYPDGNGRYADGKGNYSDANGRYSDGKGQYADANVIIVFILALFQRLFHGPHAPQKRSFFTRIEFPFKRESLLLRGGLSPFQDLGNPLKEPVSPVNWNRTLSYF